MLMMYFIHNVLTNIFWPECRTQHVGEHIVINKMHHKYWVAFVGYLHILGLINAQKTEHIKSKKYLHCQKKKKIVKG
jgi:hypothetical protein